MAINRDKVSASAIKLLQSGKYDKAISEFRRLVEDDPKDVRTLLKLGDTFVKVGKRVDAVGSYQAVADIYSEQGFYLKAVAVFKQMLRVDAQLPQVHLQLAEMYQQLGLHSDCMQHFQQVAVHYEREGQIDKTLEVLKRMVDLDPDNLPSRIKLAELFAQQGHNDKAIQEFRSAADHLKAEDRFDDFVRVAERLVYFDPSAIDVTRELAQHYLSRGDAKLALGKLQTCFKADPRNLETLALIAEAFLAMEQVPKTVSVYKEMARIYESTGNAPDANTYWQRVLELVPSDQEAHEALGSGPAPVAGATPIARPGSGAQPAPVVAAPEPAVDPVADQILRLLTETDVYVKYGLKDKAIEHLQKVFSLAPDHIEAHDKMRELCQQLGNRAGLIQQLNVLIDLGRKANDERVASWVNDLAVLEGAAAGGPAPFEADAGVDGASSIIDASVGDSNIIELEEPSSADLLIDPGIGDEPILGGADPLALPPDESVIEQEALSASDEAVPIGAESILDEAVDSQIPSGGTDFRLDEMDAGIPSNPPALPPEILDDTSAPSGESLGLEAPQPTATFNMQDSLDSMADLGDALGEELAAAAAAGIDALAGDFNEVPDSLTDDLGEGQDFFNVAAFDAAAQSTSQEGTAEIDPMSETGSAPPIDSGEGIPAGAAGATEIMSLSPEELAEIRAMASAGVAASFDDVLSREGLNVTDLAGPPLPDSAESLSAPSGEAFVSQEGDHNLGDVLPDAAEPTEALIEGLSQDTSSSYTSGPPGPDLSVGDMDELAGELEGLDFSQAAQSAADAGAQEAGFEVESAEYAMHADAFDDGNSYVDPADVLEQPEETHRQPHYTPGTEQDSEVPTGSAAPPGMSSGSADLPDEMFADLGDDELGLDATVPNQMRGGAELPGAPLVSADSLADGFDDFGLGDGGLGDGGLGDGGLGEADAGLGDLGGANFLDAEDDAALDAELAAAGLGEFSGRPDQGLELSEAELDAELAADLLPEATDPGLDLQLPAAPNVTLEDELGAPGDELSESMAASGDPVFDGAPDAEAGARTPKLGVSESAYGFEDDPAAAFYPDELEEAEFFITQELLDEAREILEEILDDVPDSPRVKWMLARVEAKEAGEPEPPAPWAEKVLDQLEEEVGDLLDDLGEPAESDGQVSVDEVLAQFKKGVAETVEASDAETHYNLGIAYREMGLLDEAIREFEISANSPAHAADSNHLMGLALIDAGRHGEAKTRFEQALAQPDLPQTQLAANEYQLGICHEALGEAGEALQAFRRAREHGAEQRDIEQRIDQATAALTGSGEGAAPNGEARPQNGAGGHQAPSSAELDDAIDTSHRKKNIDYL